MNGYDCNTVRDLLPSLIRGELPAQERSLADEHVAGCADCRAEAAVVRLIQETLDPLPAGLEARVLGAIRQAAPAVPSAGVAAAAGAVAATATDAPVTSLQSARSRRALRPILAPGRLAMAATLAAAIIGGALVFERFGGPALESGAVAFESESPVSSLLSWAAVDDPMLHGGTPLQELTTDELEALLAELDS